jgi:hypothetical protein
MKNKFKKGQLLVPIIIFSSIALVIIGGIVRWAGITIEANRQLITREKAIQLAESGIDYYRWHLAHNHTDYQDGTHAPGPYVHQVLDKDDNVVGQFSLSITPPTIGSTKVRIESTGTPASSTISRKIRVEMGIPSFAKYAMVTNSVVYYGSGDEVFGPVHSNVGVGFWSGSPQPIAHNIVTSAVSTFTDSGTPCPGTHFGVFTCVPSADPNPPNNVPNRPDVFQSGRQFPVPVVDFTGITGDLSVIKADAQSNGFYRSASGANGYKLVLKTNGTFDLYKVNSLLPAPNGCVNSIGQTNWGTWSVGTVGGATTLLGTYSYPANGLMFFEDHVWVEGQINGQRLTIVAGTFPVNSATYKNIIVNNNLTYTNFDGTDVIGLIAQGNFLVGLASASSLIIDAAIIAQNGQTIRYYYPSGCSPWDFRSTLTTYGMFASNGQGYFYYGSSGYQNQPASYDANLLYSPPPSFPLTSDQYEILSWQEI